MDNSILSQAEIARMLEAQLTSELVIAMISGIQSGKVIEGYYKRYDNEFAEQPLVIERFKHCMDVIGEIMGDNLSESNFSSKHLFYSLYCVIYDLLYGLPNSEIKQIAFDGTTIPKIRNTLESIDFIFQLEPAEIAVEDRALYDASTRHTTDIEARKIRHNYITRRILSEL